MKNKSKLMQRLAEEAQVQPQAQPQNKFTNEMYEFIVDKAKYNVDSDFDPSNNTGYVNVIATLSTSALLDKFTELTEADLTELAGVLKTDVYVQDAIREAAVDAKNDNIDDSLISSPSDFTVTADNKQITIEANYEIDGAGNEQDTNQNDPSDYHTQKDFI
ncbi:hypothetical protein D3C81_783840 [compost metagenome]